MPKPNTAPQTFNKEAIAFIRTAESKCRGCRTHWRLKTGTFVHGNSSECTAQFERQSLRDLIKKQ